MKLLHPIVAKAESGPIRLIFVVRGRSRDSILSSGDLARSYLNIVYDGPVQRVMVCDSSSPVSDVDSLESAMAIIAAGGVDLVVGSDLTSISRHCEVADRFIKCCAAHAARVIVFEDHIDSADPNWHEHITRRSVEYFSSQGGEA